VADHLRVGPMSVCPVTGEEVLRAAAAVGHGCIITTFIASSRILACPSDRTSLALYSILPIYLHTDWLPGAAQEWQGGPKPEEDS